MTSSLTRERRRVPRLRVEAERTASFGATSPAQVLEINLAGVLVGSKIELKPGERAELQATIGSRPLRVGIEIRGVSQEPRPRNSKRRQFGAAFVGLPAEQRAVLLDVLGVERS